MKAMAIEPNIDHRIARADAENAKYICYRVVDTLLREDVRECVSRSETRLSGSLPAGLSKYTTLTSTWLKVTHFGDGCLWIPVTQSAFMQDWRAAGLPLLWQEDKQVKELYAVEDILACFARGLPPASALAFNAFVVECQVAAEHRHVTETECERWFAEFRALHGAATGAQLPDWHARLLRYDRLGAFLDHPFYPTARAKLGFDADALAAYSPEFQRNFLLRWLAVPRAIYHPSSGDGLGLSPLWPSFEAVGLPAAMGAVSCSPALPPMRGCFSLPWRCKACSAAPSQHPTLIWQPWSAAQH